MNSDHGVPWITHTSTPDIDRGLGIAQLNISNYVAIGFKLTIKETWHSSVLTAD